MAKAAQKRNREIEKAKASVREIARRLGERGFRVRKAILYGSVVKGRMGRWSDVDVAFLSPDFRPTKMKQWVEIMKTCQEVDLRVEPVVFRPEDFRDEIPLAWEIKRTGIEVRVEGTS